MQHHLQTARSPTTSQRTATHRHQPQRLFCPPEALILEDARPDQIHLSAGVYQHPHLPHFTCRGPAHHAQHQSPPTWPLHSGCRAVHPPLRDAHLPCREPAPLATASLLGPFGPLAPTSGCTGSSSSISFLPGFLCMHTLQIIMLAVSARFPACPALLQSPPFSTH